MKYEYEALFGDQGLFFDAHGDCEMAGNGHYKIDRGEVMVWNFTGKRWCNSHTNTITISAMRRIIRTPTWTVEDQKAGRLPDVGAKVDGGKVVFVNGFNVVTELKSGAVIVSSPKTFLNTFKPIETPEEKAQREENEFVFLVESEYNKMPNEISFKAGIRAAYRKLKGGE